MNATEELRAILDERGESYVENDFGITWRYYSDPHTATESMDGTLIVSGITPEQAIAATLGRETCKQEERGWSTEGDHARVWLTCGHDCMVETVADLPHFCPICGAKVVD